MEIRKHGDWIGTFRLAVSTKAIHQNILYHVFGTLLLAAALIVAISQTTLYFSRKRLFEPLKQLEQSATRIAEGDMNTPIDIRLPGELGKLARSIENMRDSGLHLIDDLCDSKARLEDHCNALEKRIRERTDELEQKNRSLNQALADVQDARQAAEVANMAKSSFLASMSHEIRTPMNSILGMADVLNETRLTADQEQYVQVFKEAGDRLLLILNDIIDLAKIETGDLALNPVPFGLSEVVNGTCNAMATKVKAKELDFTCLIAPNAPDHLIGDPVRIRQVLLNLLDNAVKFTEEGHVELKVEVSGSNNAAESLLLFSVSDSGSGIRAEALDTIFDSFTQVDNSTTRRYGGTGLGLAITKELVQMMGGRIWVESTHKAGSTFYCTLNLKADRNNAVPENPQRSNPPEHKSSLPEANILMVEDSCYNAFVIQTYLKDTPCALTVAENGEDGIKAFRTGNYDAILMDIQMPGMDGHDATRAIRKWETEHHLPRTPIIAMTAHAQAEDAKQCLEAGADNHLPKPVRKSTLISLLNTMLSTPPITPADEAT